jgi:hypothetical protein
MGVITINPDKIKPLYVPPSVPLWAARIVLTERGIIDQVNEKISASKNTALKTVWEYGNTIDRNSPALLALADEIGVTNELDDLFIKAGEIKV